MSRVRVIVKDRGWNRIMKNIERVKRGPHVAVGIFGSKAAADHFGTPNIEIAAAHEFGTTIRHPGGTAYFIGPDGNPHYMSNAAAARIEAGRGRLLPRTKPHPIVLPERSFIRATVDLKRREIQRQQRGSADAVLIGKISLRVGLELVGMLVKGLIQKRMSRGIPPPLTRATIERKKSSKPLINTGQLRASVDYQARNV